MSVEMMSRVLAIREMPHRERGVRKPLKRLVLLVLANRHNDDIGRAWPSLSRLEAETDLSRRSLVRVLAELEEDGLLVTHRTAGKTNEYEMLVAASDSQAPVGAGGDSQAPTSDSQAPTSDSQAPLEQNKRHGTGTCSSLKSTGGSGGAQGVPEWAVEGARAVLVWGGSRRVVELRAGDDGELVFQHPMLGHEAKVLAWVHCMGPPLADEAAALEEVG